MTTLRKHVSTFLRTQGYRCLNRSVHLLRLDDDFSLWVNTGVVGLAADIAPYIGLRSESVEAARARFLDRPNHPTTVTVGANVGYILDGRYRAWQRGSDPTEVTQTIEAGLQKLRPLASLAALPGLFSCPGVREAPGTPYVAILVALLRHDRGSLLARLEDARLAFCIRPDEICDQFRAFEERLGAELGAKA